jgi:hypothetical protein
MNFNLVSSDRSQHAVGMYEKISFRYMHQNEQINLAGTVTGAGRITKTYAQRTRRLDKVVLAS